MSNTNKTIKIGILYYLSQDTYIKSDSLLPIQLGFYETGVDMGIQKDNTGDNRSNRHPIYSEYSGIYWMWKNIHATYKGVYQHRRSLKAGKIPPPLLLNHLIIQVKTRLKNIYGNSRAIWNPVIECKNHQDYVDEVKKTTDFITELFEKGYDIVAPSPFRFIKFTVYEHFDEVVNRELMGVVRLVIRNSFIQYYHIFESSLYDTKMFYANISVMKEDLFNEYCEFVFGVFDELEHILINESYYINLYKEKSMYRIFGYIGELLTNVYIRKKKEEGYKIKELWLLYDSSVKGNENTDYTKIKL